MKNIDKKDNSTLDDKVMLRAVALRHLGAEPVIMETHGGIGDVWASVYQHVWQGVVFEKDSVKASKLARQRPTWAVYEADCVKALALGAGGYLTVNLLDVDPYGDPWPALTAFFGSVRPFAPRMVVVVNDGMRQPVAIGWSWRTSTLGPVVEKFGNDLWDKYLEVCHLLMEEAANSAGYRVTFFDGYYTGGRTPRMTHYIGVLEK